MDINALLTQTTPLSVEQRAELATILRKQQQQESAAPTITPQDIPARLALFEQINRKPTAAWTAEERTFMQSEVRRQAQAIYGA